MIGGKQPIDDRMLPVSAYLDNVEGSHGGWWHGFPTTAEELQSSLNTIGAKSGDVIVHHYNTGTSYLDERLPKSLTHDTLDELNYLAVKLEGLTEDQFEVFDAVVESNRHCCSVKDIINITENLDRFELQPAFNAEQYGAFHINLARDEYADMMNSLEVSVDPADQDFFQYIVGIEAHVDIDAYGKWIAENENGAFTEQGYLTETSVFEDVYRGPEDIPAEYKVFAYPEPDLPLKVESAELTALVLKMHALGGDFMPDAQYNVSKLANGTAHYLLLMNERNIFLTEMGSAYYRDTMAFDVCMNSAPDIKAFALDAVHSENQQTWGSVTEIDFMEWQDDIREHSFWFTHIDAKLKGGTEQRYTLEEWDAMELIDRDRLQSWSPRYNMDDINALVSHLDEEVRKRRETPVKIVSPDDFLADLNRSYMEWAENSQQDMLRVTLPAARDMLARGDTEVYRLLLEGPKKLTPMDAVKGAAGFWYSEYREFAIKREGMAGLDKWAGRSAGEILRRSLERDAPVKPKTHGHEL